MDTIPLYLLKSIFNSLDSDFDRICLTLTCKYLFNQFKESPFIFVDYKPDTEADGTPISTIDNYNGTFKKSIELRTCHHCSITNAQTMEKINNHTTSITINNHITTLSKPLPSTIQSIKITSHIPQLQPKIIPVGCTKLMFDGKCLIGQIPINTLPNTLTHLDLGNQFKNVIYKQKKSILPPSLKWLRLGNMYNKPIEKGSLPIGLEYIYIGRSFDKEIQHGAFPNTLKTIIFHRSSPYYNILEIDFIPYGVEILKLPGNIRETKVNAIPNTVHTLRIGNISDGSLINNSTLTRLSLNHLNSFLGLPDSLLHLKINNNYGYINVTESNPLPPNLVSLVVHSITVGHSLPNTLQLLHMIQIITTDPLPSTITKLYLETDNSFSPIKYNGVNCKSLRYHEDELPSELLSSSTIETLRIGREQPIPNSIKHLILGFQYSLSMDNKWFTPPESVDQLTIYTKRIASVDNVKLDFAAIRRLKKLNLCFPIQDHYGETLSGLYLEIRDFGDCLFFKHQKTAIVGIIRDRKDVKIDYLQYLKDNLLHQIPITILGQLYHSKVNWTRQ